MIVSLAVPWFVERNPRDGYQPDMPAHLSKLLSDLEQAIPPGHRGGRAAFEALCEHLSEANLWQTRADQAASLLDGATRASRAVSASEVAQSLLDAVTQAMAAKRGFLGLIDATGTCRLAACSGAATADGFPALSTTIVEKALAGAPVVETDAGRGAHGGAASVMALGLKSVACFPLGTPRVTGFLYLDQPARSGHFDPFAEQLVSAWLPLFQEWIAAAHQREREADPFAELASESPGFRAVLDELRRVAPVRVTLLLHGETGTGKTRLAQVVHAASRRTGRMVVVSCPTIPRELFSAELFGSVKGAFTGSRDRKGFFEEADGGSLFLDEVDLMPADCQVKLLSALQDRTITRVGSTTPRAVDVRVIAAMSSEPAVAMEEGHLRRDLYYRLARVPIAVPPLRDRPEDLAPLARVLLTAFALEIGADVVPRLAEETLAKLRALSWPGNIRDLENVLCRAMLSSDGLVIRPDDIRTAQVAPTAGGATRNIQRRTRRGRVGEDEFRAAWGAANGDVQAAASALGVTVRSVYRYEEKFGSRLD